jgi:hypothetical protein
MKTLSDWKLARTVCCAIMVVAVCFELIFLNSSNKNSGSVDVQAIIGVAIVLILFLFLTRSCTKKVELLEKS